jgi:fumarate reductase subunit D
LFAFCLSMVDLVKDSSVFTAGFITSFTILWISVPVYLLLLTFLTPLVIIVEDTFLFASVRKSVSFIRENLSETVKLVLIIAPLWAFAFFLIRVYNDRDLFLLTVFFLYLIAVLEVSTVKVFLLFYTGRGKDNG